MIDKMLKFVKIDKQTPPKRGDLERKRRFLMRSIKNLSEEKD